MKADRFERGADPFPPNDDGDGDGSGGGGRYTRQDLERQAERAVEEGKATEKIANLLEDVYEERQRRREAEGKLERVPDALFDESEEALVLTGESVETYERYTDLGEPDEIEDAIEDGREARQRMRNLERKQAIREAAEAHGLNSAPLARLAEDDGLEVEIRTEEDDEGEETDVAFVRPEDDDEASATRLTDYAEENWGEFAPALTADSSGGGEDDEEDEGGGTRFPDQSEGGSAPDREPSVEDIKDRKKEKHGTKL